MSKPVSLAAGFCSLFLFNFNSAAQTPAIDDHRTVTLPGNIHPHARPQFDAGPVDPKMPLDHMILALQARSVGASRFQP